MASSSLEPLLPADMVQSWEQFCWLLDPMLRDMHLPDGGHRGMQKLRLDLVLASCAGPDGGVSHRAGLKRLLERCRDKLVSLDANNEDKLRALKWLRGKLLRVSSGVAARGVQSASALDQSEHKDKRRVSFVTLAQGNDTVVASTSLAALRSTNAAVDDVSVKSTSPSSNLTVQELTQRRAYMRMRHIKSLEDRLVSLNEQIKQLECRENDLDDLDNADSPYIMCEKLKAAAAALYKRLCKLRKTQFYTGRPVECPFRLAKTSKYACIDSKIEQLINRRRLRKKEFPDLQDVSRLVKYCNARHSLNLGESEADYVAKKLFEQVGEQLQHRRKEDYRKTMGCYLTDCPEADEDPALNDAQLYQRLKRNDAVAAREMQQVLDKFEELQAMHKGDQSVYDCCSEEESEPEVSEEEEDACVSSSHARVERIAIDDSSDASDDCENVCGDSDDDDDDDNSEDTDDKEKECVNRVGVAPQNTPIKKSLIEGLSHPLLKVYTCRSLELDMKKIPYVSIERIEINCADEEEQDEIKSPMKRLCVISDEDSEDADVDVDNAEECVNGHLHHTPINERSIELITLSLDCCSDFEPAVVESVQKNISLYLAEDKDNERDVLTQHRVSDKVEVHEVGALMEDSTLIRSNFTKSSDFFSNQVVPHIEKEVKQVLNDLFEALCNYDNILSNTVAQNEQHEINLLSESLQCVTPNIIKGESKSLVNASSFKVDSIITISSLLESTTVESANGKATNIKLSSGEASIGETGVCEPISIEATIGKPTNIELSAGQVTNIEPSSEEATTGELIIWEPTNIELPSGEATNIEPFSCEATIDEPSSCEHTIDEPTNIELSSVESTNIEPSTHAEFTNVESAGGSTNNPFLLLKHDDGDVTCSRRVHSTITKSERNFVLASMMAQLEKIFPDLDTKSSSMQLEQLYDVFETDALRQLIDVYLTNSYPKVMQSSVDERAAEGKKKSKEASICDSFDDSCIIVASSCPSVPEIIEILDDEDAPVSTTSSIAISSVVSVAASSRKRLSDDAIAEHSSCKTRLTDTDVIGKQISNVNDDRGISAGKTSRGTLADRCVNIKEREAAQRRRNAIIKSDLEQRGIVSSSHAWSGRQTPVLPAALSQLIKNLQLPPCTTKIIGNCSAQQKHPKFTSTVAASAPLPASCAPLSILPKAPSKHYQKALRRAQLDEVRRVTAAANKPQLLSLDKNLHKVITDAKAAIDLTSRSTTSVPVATSAPQKLTNQAAMRKFSSSNLRENHHSSSYNFKPSLTATRHFYRSPTVVSACSLATGLTNQLQQPLRPSMSIVQQMREISSRAAATKKMVITISDDENSNDAM